MQILTSVLFLAAALINLAPVIGVLSGAHLEALYAIPFEDSNLLVLMRHRALLFGIVGGMLAAAAFYRPLRSLATAIGLFSMVSFLAMVLLEAPVNDALVRVGWIDAAAIGLLVAGWTIDRYRLA